MSVWSAILIALAGTGAGIINTIVGSGTLLTFPTLLFFGFNPLVANVSNNIGLVAGGVTGSWGYRHELTGQAPALRRLMPLSFLGSIIGAGLLLVLPPEAFKTIVPVLILVALVMVLLGPRLQRHVVPRTDGAAPGWHAPVMAVGVLLAGMYGGYFGAAQGVLLMGLFSLLSAEPLQRLNAYLRPGPHRLGGRRAHRGRGPAGWGHRGPDRSPDPAAGAARPDHHDRHAGDRQADLVPLTHRPQCRVWCAVRACGAAALRV